MNLVGQKVNHIKFGAGVITKIAENIIWVLFSDQIGMKAFLYPEAFETFLKAINPEVSNLILEALRDKKDQARLELERKTKKHQEELDASKKKFTKKRSGFAGKKSMQKPKKTEV